jgi:cytochrome c oxidase assembly protein subunit 15
MTGGIRYEHSHRIFATLTGLLTLGLFVQLRFRPRASRPPIAFGYLALLLVVVQGALGGATVLLRLPPAISEAHLMVGTSFFATTLWLAWSTRHDVRPVWRAQEGLHRRVRVAALLAFAQILLGGLVRHTASSLVCPSFPTCHEGVWFDLTSRGIVHMGHRAGALVLGVALCRVACAALRDKRSLRTLGHVLALLVLLLGQIVLGVASVVSLLSVWIVVAHLAVGQLLFACLCLFDFHLAVSANALGGTDDGRHPSLRPSVLFSAR